MTRSRSRGPIIAIVAITLLVQLFMIVTDMSPHLLLVATVCVLSGVGVWLVFALGKKAVRYESVSDPHREQPGRLPDLRVTLIRQGLSYGRHDNLIPQRMYDSLVTLIDDELTVNHGIDRAADPEAARAVVGNELMRFIESPDDARALHLDGLRRVIGQIERIEPEAYA